MSVWYSFICGAISFHYFPPKLMSDCWKSVSKQCWWVALIGDCKCVSRNIQLFFRFLIYLKLLTKFYKFCILTIQAFSQVKTQSNFRKFHFYFFLLISLIQNFCFLSLLFPPQFILSLHFLSLLFLLIFFSFYLLSVRFHVHLNSLYFFLVKLYLIFFYFFN